MKKLKYCLKVLMISSALTFSAANTCLSQWSECSSGLNITGYVMVLVKNSGVLLAGTDGGGIYRSSDNGAVWFYSSGGLDLVDDQYNSSFYINALFPFSGNVIFAGTYNGVFRSTDNGYTWVPKNNGVVGSPYCFYSSYPYICVTTNMGIYKSSDLGESWTPDFGINIFTKVIYYNSNFYASSYYQGMFRSTDFGLNWSAINNGLPGGSYKRIRALSSFSGALYVSVDTAYNTSFGIYKSTNNGNSWFEVNNGITDKRIRSFTNSEDKIYAGGFGKVFASSDYGAQWYSVNDSLKSFVYSLLCSGGDVFAGSKGIYYSSDSGSHWSPKNYKFNYFSMRDVSSAGNLMLCNTDYPYKSTNNGSTWSLSSNSINTYTYCIYGLNASLFAGSEIHGVFKSTNNGENWFQSNNGIPDSLGVRGFYYNNGYLFASMEGLYGAIYRSSNEGLSWEMPSNNNYCFTFYAPYGTRLFAGSPQNGLFYTTNNGNNWNASLNAGVSGIAFCDNNVFASTTNGGILWSPDNGFSWTTLQTGPPEQRINTLFGYGNNIIAGTKSGIYASSNAGLNWTVMNDGLLHKNVIKFYVKDEYIYAATDINGLYRRPKGEIISVKKVSEVVPSECRLYQNFPNPFNPRTAVRFQVAGRSDVSIIVYDVQGKEVKTLVNERMNPGVYETSFDGSSLSSGVYFCVLKLKNFTRTIKMSLIK